MQIRMLYPETRWVDESAVVAWGWDRRIDAAVDELAARLGRAPTDGEYQQVLIATPVPSFDEARELLEDEGAATFSTEIRP